MKQGATTTRGASGLGSSHQSRNFVSFFEMKSLFDWKRVEREVRVVTPEFQVWKNGKLASIVIYIKMSRGEMTRFILKNRIENPEDLKSFSWEGFEFNESLSDEKKFVFTNGKEI